MGSAAICTNTKSKHQKSKNEYDIFSKNLDNYLRKERNREYFENIESEQNKSLNKNIKSHKTSSSADDIDDSCNLVYKSKNKENVK